jgi:bla regulator protein BlaR1
MTSSVIQALTELTLATSVAVIVVALLRRIVESLAGIRIAYWRWLLLPVSALGVLLPPLPSPIGGSSTVTETVRGLVDIQLYSEQIARAAVDYSAVAAILWVAGGVFMLVLVLRRQLALLRSLADATAVADGVYHSAAIRGPLLVGVFRPRIVLPTDFESRYTPEERVLILAHERAHLRRRDTLVNGIATLSLCLFWFNPLMHWAIARLRLDQELACDAAVLATSGVGRRRYADALLRTHLANEASWRTPVACCWRSDHPLKERIVMLSRPLPTFSRRFCGAAVTAALIILGGCAAWSAREEAAHDQPSQAYLDGSSTIRADRIVKEGSGSVLFSGNVVITLGPGTPSTPSASSLTSSSVVVHQAGEHQSMAYFQDLRLVDDRFVITAAHARVETDGTKTVLTTDSARISPVVQTD